MYLKHYNSNERGLSVRKIKLKDPYKSIIFNLVSAIIIVLSWYILYYIFRNYGEILYTSQTSTPDAARSKAEELNLLIFFGVYFFVELINYYFNGLKFRNYAFIQVVLDGCLFLLLGGLLRDIVFFIPTNTANDQYAVIRSWIEYFQQYILVAIGSNAIMIVLNSIRMWMEYLKERRW